MPAPRDNSEWNSARMSDDGCPIEEPEMVQQDTSPIIAIFRNRESADGALFELRSSGIANEDIGVAYSDSAILSVANRPGTDRATGQINTNSNFKDALLDSFRPPSQPDLPAMPNTANYDPYLEAKQYQHPFHQVMVSVQSQPGQRKKIREILLRFGAAA